jgi:hypothetical protein
LARDPSGAPPGSPGQAKLFSHIYIERNKPCIKLSELQQFFKKLEKQKASKIKQHGEGEAVLVDLQKDLNLPVVIDMMGDTLEVRMKTIMRKKNFHTPDEKLTV